MGGGPSKSDYAMQSNIANKQVQIGEEELQLQREDRAKAQALQQPLIDKQTKLATGDRNAAISAAMPTISKISQGYDSAKRSIFNTVTPGAARDKSLADLEIQKYTATSGAQAQAVEGAPEILANLGTGMGAFSLQELGAALSGFSGGASTSNDIISGKNASKANSVGLISGLAQAAGQTAGAFAKPSDARLKINVRPLDGALALARKIGAFRFDYVDSMGGAKGQMGVMAQEVSQHIPGIVHQAFTETDRAPYLTVDYAAIAALALAAVKELQAEVDELRRQVEQAQEA